MEKSKIYFLIGLGLFIVTLTIYIFTLSPTIHPRDNPDIITAAATLGLAHPPGYPLYTVLGHLVAKIPLGSIPYRINLMSALFSATTVFLIYLIILKLTKKVWPALIGASMLAFSFSYFIQSLYADYLSLNNFLVASEILVLLVWYEKRQIKYLYLFSFIFGLALSHHQISLLLSPAFIYLFWTTDRKVFSWQNLLKFGGFFLLGLLPFLYLPIRAAQHPEYIWGNPGSLGGFFEMITRQEYRSSSGGSFKYIGDFAFRIWDWFKLISWKEFFILGFGLGILGLIVNWYEDKKIAIFFLLMIISSGPVFALFSDTPRIWIEAISMERFFIFSYMIFAIAIGLGLAWLFERFNKIGFIALLIPLFLIGYNLPRANLRHYYYAYDLAQNILKTLPPNTVFFGGTDVPLFELWYLQKVEKVRPDVKILLGGDPKLGGFLPSMINRQYQDFPDGKLPLKELSKKYPIYTANNVDLFWGSQTDNLVPEGIVYRYNPDANWPKSFDAKIALENFQNYTYRGSYKITKTHEKFTDEILYYYVNGWTNLGIAFQHSQQYDQAAQAYEKALEIDPNYIIAQNNFAGTLLERGHYQEAADHFKEILKKYPALTSAQNGLMIAEKKLSE